MKTLIGVLRSRRILIAASAICLGTCLGSGLTTPAHAASNDVIAMSAASALFKTKCTGCHTFGKGVRVGPDLKRVTDRHPRPWLIAWIKSSTRLIQSGDTAAVALFRMFKEQRMPDHELSDGQIVALLDFLAADGPDADEQQRIREASTATAADIEWGRRLFYGESTLKSGDLACVACHSVSRQTALGGQLADDLTDAYRKYHDKALDQVLKHACLPREPALRMARVEDHESLALRAFLRTLSPVANAGSSASAHAAVNAGAAAGEAHVARSASR
jgi:mono/diheme cytochrome c family protein